MTGRRAPRRIDALPEQFFTGILAAAAKARAEPGPRFVDLGRGNPDLPPPPHAVEALRAAALETKTPAVHGYPPFQGTPELKQAIADRYAADHGVHLDPETEVAVVPGTKTGIMLAALATAQDGDAILLPDPGYPDYLSGAALAGAQVTPLRLDPTNSFQPDFDTAPSDGTAALAVLNYPSNPTAATVRPGTFENAIAYANAQDAWVLNDLAYGFLTYDDAPLARSILSTPGARDVAIELWSPSKIYGMAGWRIGFAVGNATLVARIKSLVDHMTAGVWVGLQRGLAAALTSDQADVAQRRAVYATRRDLVVRTLTEAGHPPAPVEGSFFVWWPLPDGVTPESLIARQRVGVAPGQGFGATGRGYARLSLALADEDVALAAERLANAAT